MKVDEYEEVLKDIMKFGHKNPGCGFSCSEKARKILEKYNGKQDSETVSNKEV